MLIDGFRAAGVLSAAEVAQQNMVDERTGVPTIKWHATVMNSKWRAANGPRVPFDARPLLSQFGAMDWGRLRVPALQLCHMQGHECLERIALP